MSTDSTDPKSPDDSQDQAIAARLIDLPIEDELKDSYLTYAMSVIVSRALPDARDGLKPSQRRILMAMNDLNVRTEILRLALTAKGPTPDAILPGFRATGRFISPESNSARNPWPAGWAWWPS